MEVSTGKIKVVEITEHEDGSATLQLDLDEKTFGQIFNIGFVHLIKKAIKTEEEQKNG